MNLKVKNNTNIFNAILIVSLASTFYICEFFLRVTPSVLTNQWMIDFNISSGLIGILSTFLFFYGYWPMQLPAGVLADKYGPKKVLILATLICSISTIWLASTTYTLSVAITRVLTGVASSVAFIGPLMLARQWFNEKYFWNNHRVNPICWLFRRHFWWRTGRYIS